MTEDGQPDVPMQSVGDAHAMLTNLLRQKSDRFVVQVFRYGFVAGLAFVVDFTSLWVFTEFAGLHYLVSAVLAFCLGLTTNYTLSVCWVFSQRRLTNRTLEFTINASIALVGLGLNVLIIWAFTELVGLHYLVSKLISTATVFWWNFLVKKKLLFTKGPAASAAASAPAQPAAPPPAAGGPHA